MMCPDGTEEPGDGHESASVEETAEVVRSQEVRLTEFIPGSIVTDVLLLVVVIEPDGSVVLKHGWNPSMTWIMRRGILDSAIDVHRLGYEAE